MKLLVTLHVEDFVAFEQFEHQASRIMAKYGGRILLATELSRDEQDRGTEFHLVSFPDDASFAAYKKDDELQALAPLRARAISKTEVQQVLVEKTYGGLDKKFEA